jgi:hypothetical protein
MFEIIDGHIQCHVLDPEHPPGPEQAAAVTQLVDVIRSYLK